MAVSGNYTVTVTNGANGCTNTATVSVGQNKTPPTATVSAETLTCADTLSQITTTTNANPATFSWAGPGAFASALQNPEVAVSGNYTVTVTNGANGCTTTATATVNQNITPPVAAVAQPGNLNCLVSSLQLNGTPSSQGPNFDYLWTTPDGNIVEGDTTLTPTVDATGTYNLVVVNANNGCTSTAGVIVVQSPQVTAAVNNVVPVACNGGQNGSATAIGGGGFGVFTYNWSNGDTTATTTNLAPGTYIVTITDAENCTATATATITQPTVLNANATATGETASGANDGTATSGPSGGTPGYTYLWSTNETTATITNLSPGNYTVTATDANGCTAVQIVTVNSFNCTISATATTTNVTCNGAGDGTATVTLNGAALPATFLWSNGDTTAMATNLVPGTYTVEITDANNCPAELSVQITGPAVLLANVSATHESGVGLNNGTATAQPTGGTAPFLYFWSNNATTQTITGLAPGQYTVTVTDDNGCTAVQTTTVNAFGCSLAATISTLNVLCNGGNTGQATAIPTGGVAPITYLWSNGAATATASNLVAGIYTVNVSDAAGCQTVSMATITQPSPLVAQISVTPTSCPENLDGAFSLAFSGGVSPYQISWTGGGSNQNLGVGTYSITVIDANACTILETVIITSNDTITPVISCPISVTGCAGVSLQYPVPGVSDNCNLGGVQVELISGLPSGSNFPVGESVLVYQITDVSGNKSTCSFSVTVGQPIEITLDATSNDVGNTGVGGIQITVGGGTGNLMFAWEKDGQPFAITEDLGNLTAGVYTLTVSDQNGCARTLPPVTIDNTVSTIEPDAAVSVRIVPNPASLFIRVEMRGIQPAVVQLLDGKGRLLRTVLPAEWQNRIEVASLPAGLHYVQVLDANGRSFLAKWVKAD
ncbi:MAG: HYR domain-containing protein [Lewinellaceae bacterium]|nr:HYR domain-containing protein [Lewinellaceae bacterium]